MSSQDSRSSTPLTSSSTTLTGLDSPRQKNHKRSPSIIRENVFESPLVSASDAIEFIASRSISTSTVYLYDLAEQAGFGAITKAWSEISRDTASVVRLQTRHGAGRNLLGNLLAGPSHQTTKSGVLTAYTTPVGLSFMAHSLSYLPAATPFRRLVIQVPRVIPIGESFTLSPSLAPLTSVIPLIPENVVILLSATPQESVDLAALSYDIKSSHVIHIFDYHSSSRELGHSIIPPFTPNDTHSLTVPEVIRSSGYTYFEYAGDERAQIVVFILNGPLALNAKALAAQVTGLGVVVVRVLRPWAESALREILPPDVQHVHVIDDVHAPVTQGSLYVDVLGSLVDVELPVHAHRVTPSRTQEFLSKNSIFAQFLLSLLPNPPASVPSPRPSDIKKLLFFSTPRSQLSHLPQLIEGTFVTKQGISARLLTGHDLFSKLDGVTADRILLQPKDGNFLYSPIDNTLPLAAISHGESDFLAVLDPSLLKSHSITKFAKPGTVVLVATPWSGAELVSSLPYEALSLIVERRLHIYVFDAKALAARLVDDEGPARDAVQNLLLYHAFLRLYIGPIATESLVYDVARTSLEEEVESVKLIKISALAWAGLFEVEIPSSLVDDKSAPSTLREYEFNAVVVETEADTATHARLGSWHDAAKHIIFSEVFTPPLLSEFEEYSQIPTLRPEVPERTYLITCTVNRRLTPLEYDRNVFHVEFDTSGTGLKYAIGEALGVHGWNDEQDILDFCDWYGVDPNRFITIPVVAGEGKMHTRTVMQILQQQIDIFGRPPKSFYTDLAPYASDKVDKLSLLFIGSPEGSATFKKLAEKDTVNFADVLRLYPSARPGIEKLCELIGDIQPRHYSIASAQSVVGDRVDLLVVTVEWVTPSGSPRYGQCTRYLAGLRPGQKSTVSIKPSVMKLPPDTQQPIIMAGLGTGAAPFRAFLQHRALLAAQQISVGPTYYYFGSRHRSQEYLYGEEVEAYIIDGTISRAGLAFSRDGPRKVYIQHKMLEDAEALVKMLHDEQGVFYLCGPTWPVPDVSKALIGALVKYKGQDPDAASAFLEGLKEEERYVLEVY